MKAALHVGLVAMIGTLAACSSAPIHYYTLRPPLSREATTAPAAQFFVNVLPVGIPAELDQPQMVVRQDQSGVAVLDGERWVSPLGDEVRGALSTHLATMLNTQDVAGLSQQPHDPVLLVKVQIRRIDAWPGQRVQLVADWELAFANDPKRIRMSGSGCFDEVAVAGYPQLTSAYQRAVQELAARISVDARALPGPG